MLQPEIESGPAGLLHLQEINSKISRHGCSAIRQSETFRGEADQLPLRPACVYSKIAAVFRCSPAPHSPPWPLQYVPCAAIGPFLMHDCGKIIVTVLATRRIGPPSAGSAQVKCR
jgi:hypothetical protein